MSDERSKYIPALLTILRTRTDSDHPMKYDALMETLRTEYGLTPTRKTVAGNIGTLIGLGFPLENRHGWYYEHEFCPAELNMLIDSVLSASQITEAQRSEMVKKLRRLGGEHYVPAIESAQAKLVNHEFLLNLEMLHTAIAGQKQVSFHYADFGVDKKLHCRLNDRKRPKVYRINPYRIAAANGRYYLICNVDKYDSLSHFRVERILDVRILKTKAKPLSRMMDLDGPMDLQAYMAQHPLMYTGKPGRYLIRVRKEWINEVFDTFGMGIELSNETEETFDALVQSDAVSVDFWLKKFAGDAELVGERKK